MIKLYKNNMRYQLVGRRSRKVGKTGFLGGYKIIAYHPSFGGRNEYGLFQTKKEAQKYLKKLKK